MNPIDKMLEENLALRNNHCSLVIGTDYSAPQAYRLAESDRAGALSDALIRELTQVLLHRYHAYDVPEQAFDRAKKASK